MKNLDSDFDTQMSELEAEWRKVYEDSIAARASYQALAANRSAKANLLDMALDRLERADELKARIMAKIERLEHRILQQG